MARPKKVDPPAPIPASAPLLPTARSLAPSVATYHAKLGEYAARGIYHEGATETAFGPSGTKSTSRGRLGDAGQQGRQTPGPRGRFAGTGAGVRRAGRRPAASTAA